MDNISRAMVENLNDEFFRSTMTPAALDDPGEEVAGLHERAIYTQKHQNDTQEHAVYSHKYTETRNLSAQTRNLYAQTPSRHAETRNLDAHARNPQA
jgi:hypothetical protein